MTRFRTGHALPGGWSEMVEIPEQGGCVLNELMAKYGSDKATHGFCPFYESFFGPIREDVKKVLEVGVYHGASMLAWLDYFPNAKVLGIDDGTFQQQWPLGTDRAQVYIADQGARTQLALFLARAGDGFDLILDDGSHTMWGQQVSLACLLPAVKKGGFYVVEDLHSSFFPVIGYEQPRRYYATGCDFPLTTTFDVLDQWPDLKSDYVTQDEWDRLVARVGKVEVFGGDGDHKHITSMLEVK